MFGRLVDMATRTLIIDLSKGTGGEPMYGMVTVQRTRATSEGTFEVLPWETKLKLFNGIATITEAVTDGSGPFYRSAYLIRVQNGYCAPRWGFMVALPDGTTPISTGDMPKVNPITGEGIYMDAQEWNELYGTLPNRVSGLEVSQASQDGRLDSIEAKNTAQDSGIINAKAEAIADATTKYGGLPTRVSTLETDKWFKGDFSNFEQDLNNYTTTGVRGILTTAASNMPVATIGVLKVYKVGVGAIQEYTTWSAIPRTYWRRLASGSWGAWSEGSLVGRIDTLEADKWKRGTLAGGTDFNTVFTSGEYAILSTVHPNSPEAVLGALEVLPVSTWFIQRYTTTSVSPVIYLRRYTSSWSAWVKQPARAELDTLTSRIGALEGSGAQTGKSGMKVVPLTMTAPGTPLSTTTDKGAVRWARRYAVMPKRVRVHVANANTGNALKGNKSLTISHIRVGVGDADGGYTNGVIAQTGGSLKDDGSEVVTPWTTLEGLADGGFVTVTVGWYGGGGTATLQNNQGGGWVANDHALAGSSTTAEWTRSQTTPLHCWVEAEVPASTPVVLGNGDSITVGTATTDPVGDAWVSKYAYDNGALPVILAMHGSTMSLWTAGASRWKQYGTFDLNAVVDAIVTTLGQNDLPVTGMDLATLQARHATFMAALRGIFPQQPVYLGAITPSNKNATLEQLRRDFNAWRAEPAQRERGVLDFATVLGGVANEDLLPEYSADGLHPNTAGQEAMAALVESLPVTPYTLSPSKLKALPTLA